MYWPVLALLAYVGINLFLLSRHENWRDEAQAWQIAKNLGLGGLFAQLRYEGHPCLWYLILMPFAKLGMPFSCMGLISLAFMSVAAWLVLKKSALLVAGEAGSGIRQFLCLLLSGDFQKLQPDSAASCRIGGPVSLSKGKRNFVRRGACGADADPCLYGGPVLPAFFFWLCETAADLWKQKQPEKTNQRWPVWACPC